MRIVIRIIISSAVLITSKCVEEVVPFLLTACHILVTRCVCACHDGMSVPPYVVHYVRESFKTRLHQPVSPHVNEDLACLIRYYSFLCSIIVRMGTLFSEQKTKNLYDQCHIPENCLYMYIQHNTGFLVWFSIYCRALKIIHLDITALTIH
jgi:hypothetical protein